MKNSINITESGILYENPLPQLRSRQAHFPNVVQLSDGRLLAAFTLGEALESIDYTTVLSISSDNGKTWKLIGPLYDKDKESIVTTDCMKLTYVSKDKLIAFGYRFIRENPDLPIGNPETGGLLTDELILFESRDEGKTWSDIQIIPTSYAEGVEASAPLYVLSNGSWVSPIANFLMWDGTTVNGAYGSLLCSSDNGKTWNNNTLTMRLPGSKTGIWEQRACELEPGSVLDIAWVEDAENGIHLPNHYAVSHDYGKSFGPARSTGINGQAANVYYLGDNQIISLHCMRRDTENLGILACIVDISNDDWNIQTRKMIWTPNPYGADTKRHDIFAFMRFGQPGITHLNDGSYFMYFWYEDNGQAKILWQRLKIE